MSENVDRRQSGFTLLEVIVSFAALVVVVPAVLHLFSTAFTASDRTDSRVRALLEAESRLAEFSVPPRLKPGRFDGVSAAGAAWHVSITPHEKNKGAQGSRPLLKAYRIVVSVEPHGRAGDGVTLRTVRLVRGTFDVR